MRKYTDKDIEQAKQDLEDKWGITNDRELFKLIGIDRGDHKSMIHAWVRYQSMYEYRDGYEDCESSIVSDIEDMLSKYYQSGEL